MQLEFDWEDDKAASNLRKHDVDFDVAVDAFFDPHVFIEPDRFAMDEWRYRAIGFADGRLLTIIFSEPDAHVTRLISARRASRNERKLYEASF